MSHQPHWIHHETGLHIRVGQRVDAVPADLRNLLSDTDFVDITTDPARDLVYLDSRLRAECTRLHRALELAETSAATAKATLDDAGPLRRPGARRRFASAAESHSRLVDSIEQLCARQQQVREFVIGLDAPRGLLAESGAGWRLSPDFPASVIVFDDEASFLAVDPRRADMSAGYPRIAGNLHGEQWRRDGDDDEPGREPVDRVGPWSLGYIAGTGEIYATRRSAYHPQQVWLLGRDFNPDEAHPLLTDLEPAMRRPNSLILAAGTVHGSRSLRSGWSSSRYTPIARHPAQDTTDVDSAGHPTIGETVR